MITPKKNKGKYKTSIIVQLVTRMMCPFIIMFGVFLIVHGHLTPGGGFQGGVIIGASFILFALAFNRQDGRDAVPSFTLKCLASIGVYLYISIGLVGIFLGYHFLTNKATAIAPMGMFGELLSGGALFWINLGVGLTVAGICTELFYVFLEEERSPYYLENKKKLPYQRRCLDVDKDDSV